MENNDIIKHVAEIVEQKFTDDSSGHDWWHMYRVWQLSRLIGKKESADMLIVELGALLHDIADFKFHDGDLSAGPKEARRILESFKVDEKIVSAVCHIVENVSFKGAGETNKMKSLEGLVVQDADRLDAIGAIGITRVFAYSGWNQRTIHDPKQKPAIHKNFEEYKSGNNTAINHFYEKLLILKDRMNTKVGKEIAQNRHKYMEDFLDEFYAEWDGTK